MDGNTAGGEGLDIFAKRPRVVVKGSQSAYLKQQEDLVIDPQLVNEYEEVLDRAIVGAMSPPVPNGRLTAAQVLRIQDLQESWRSVARCRGALYPDAAWPSTKQRADQLLCRVTP